ncbi:hypothetical protein J4433_00490 [Candidatus Pacearchaeota archaeon]|nr:hypothetical protein [Candidatus Pacearchaeota archaeon]
MPKTEKSLDEKIEPHIASEMFEQAAFLYGSQSVKETVRVMKKLGLERVARIALGDYYTQ